MDMILAIGVALGLLPLVIWGLRSFNEWRWSHPYLTSRDGVKLPPGHMGWPFIGELLDFLWCFKFTSKPDDFIWKRKAKYGDTGIYRTHIFGSPAIITCSPEANKFVLGSDSFSAGWPCPKLVGENSVVNVEGKQHKRIRRSLQEAINNPESLQRNYIKLHPEFKEAFHNWAVKGEIKAADETRALAFKNICALVFSFSGGPMVERMEMMYRGLLAGVRAHPINVPGTAFHYALQCRKKLSNIVLFEIYEREKNKGNVKKDILQGMIDLVDSNGDRLSEEEIMDTLTSLLLAGYETTASSMTWLLYYLSKYPKVLEKIKEENSSIHEQKGEGMPLTYDDARKMTYTSKVIDEVIRLANSVNFLFRLVAKDTEFNGYKFPKGWKVLIWLRTLHVDPHYFKDPLEFNPMRWDGFKPRPGVYNVFGGGPRQCPGNNLARMELLMFLYYICMDYKWKLANPDEEIKFIPNPRLANGARLKFMHK